MLKLKDTITQVLLIGLSCSVHASLHGETLTSLTVTGTARIGHLHVAEKSHMQGHLNVDDDVDMKGKLEVRGDSLVKGHAEIQGSLNCENNVNIVKKLTVHKQGVFKENLIVDGDSHLRKNLQDDDKATFKKNVTVHGFLHDKGYLIVDGDACIKGTSKCPETECAGNLCVGKDLEVDSNQTVAKDVAVGKNAHATNNVQIAGDELLAGNLLLVGTESITGGLNIGEGTNISKSLYVGENASIGHNLCISGDVCLFGNLDAKNIKNQKLTLKQLTNVESITVNNDATVFGTLFTNEIDPIGPCLTHFSGNVAIEKAKKLFIHSINPTNGKEVAEGECPCTPQSGTINLSGNTAVFPKRTLLVNHINPLLKRANCNDASLPNENGTTCLSGNVGIDPHNGPKKLLVNWIDPVKLVKGCTPQCQSDVYGTTSFSGNVALQPNNARKLLVNEINPVKLDENGNYIADDIENGTTCFSGHVGIHPKHFLLVNEINPTKPQSSKFCDTPCPENQDPCIVTSLSGGMSIKHGHIFGQFDDLKFNCAEPAAFFGDADSDPLAAQLGFPITKCTPVLRLTFKNIDPNASPFPQGAWVKLSLLGKANLHLVECPNAQTPCPRTISTDIFSELYFFVGAGYNAPCSSFVGSLSNIDPSSGFNTLSGFGCDTKYFSTKSSTPFLRGGGFPWNNSLNAFMPTVDSPSPITILGTTASSATKPYVVDILLTGLFRTIDVTSTTITEFIFPNSYENFSIADMIDLECPFDITNISLFFEVISPNLDPENPPCFPNPPLEQCIYDQACQDLITTFTTAAPSAFDVPDFDDDITYEYEYVSGLL